MSLHGIASIPSVNICVCAMRVYHVRRTRACTRRSLEGTRHKVLTVFGIADSVCHYDVLIAEASVEDATQRIQQDNARVSSTIK